MRRVDGVEAGGVVDAAVEVIDGGGDGRADFGAGFDEGIEPPLDDGDFAVAFRLAFLGDAGAGGEVLEGRQDANDIRGATHVRRPAVRVRSSTA